MPSLGFHECAEMSTNYWSDDGSGDPPRSSKFTGHQSLMRRAYYGCLSYADHLIGRVMDTVDALPQLTASTAVVFLGDHGWHLGEHDLWCKMTTYELGTRIPLIIRAPWVTRPDGSSAANGTAVGLAEAVDLYPTLSELAGLPLPTGAAGADLGGVSLVPLMNEPETGAVKEVTLSQFPRCWQNNTHVKQSNKPGDENNRTNSWFSMSDCHWTERAFIDFMGYKMRTPEWAVTEWLRWNGTALRPIWEESVGVELYSHAGNSGIGPASFDDFENVNLAGSPDHAKIEAKLRARLKVEVERWITPFTPSHSTASTVAIAQSASKIAGF